MVVVVAAVAVVAVVVEVLVSFPQTDVTVN